MTQTTFEGPFPSTYPLLSKAEAAAIYAAKAATFLKFPGTGGTPTAVAGAGAGSSPPVPIVNASDTDSHGQISFGTGTGPSANSAQVVVTYTTPYTAAPHVVLTANNSLTQALGLFIQSFTANGFVVGVTNAPAASQAASFYSFNYAVLG